MDLMKLKKETHANSVDLISPKSGVGLEYLIINNFGSNWQMLDYKHISFLCDNNFKIEDINYGTNNKGYYLLASRNFILKV